MGRIPTKRRLALFMLLFVLSTTICSAQKVNLNFSQKSLRTVLESITEQTDHEVMEKIFGKRIVKELDKLTHPEKQPPKKDK